MLSFIHCKVKIRFLAHNDMIACFYPFTGFTKIFHVIVLSHARLLPRGVCLLRVSSLHKPSLSSVRLPSATRPFDMVSTHARGRRPADKGQPIRLDVTTSLDRTLSPSEDADMVSTDSPSIARVDSIPLTESSNEPCHLMELPKELRDEIYDLLAHDTEVKSFGFSNLEGFLRSAPRAALLRVSKQFSAEYEARISKVATLVIRANIDESLMERPEFFPWRFLHQAELHVYANYYERLSWIVQRACKWIDHFQATSPNLLSFRVMVHTLNLCEECYYPDDLQNAMQHGSAMITGWPFSGTPWHTDQVLKAFERIVYRQDVVDVEIRYRCQRYMFEAPTAPRVYGTWTKAQGWKSGRVEDAPSKNQVEETETSK